MGLSAVIQLIRNALCCIKGLKLFPNSFLHNVAFTGAVAKMLFGSELPYPFYKATPIEVIIAVTQLYACLSLSIGGFKMLTQSGISKFRRIMRLLEKNANPVTSSTDKTSQTDTIVNKLANSGLVAEGETSIRNIIVGSCLLVIGITFFWLFANSLHVTETGWIGGVAGVIHALTFMEVAFVPLLYYMGKDGFDKFRESRAVKKLPDKIEAASASDGPLPWLDIKTLNLVRGEWKPFWSEPVTVAPYDEILTREYNEEKDKLRDMVNSLLSTYQTSSDESKEAKEKKTKAVAELRERLPPLSRLSLLEGYREIVYLILNFAAFYGFLLGIIVYYHHDEHVQGFSIRCMKFGFSNADADWGGNFFGDLMWTIEPMIILGSPLFLNIDSMKSGGKSSKKVKDE